MEIYKKLIIAGVALIVFTTLSACTSLPPVLSGFFMISGILSLGAGFIKGRKDFLQTSEELKMLDEGMERESKIRLVTVTIGCKRDDAIGFLKEYDWDEIKIFLDFKKFPERFYGDKKAIPSYIEAGPVPNINPVTVSNCLGCGNLCPENMACCPACKTPLYDNEMVTSPLLPSSFPERQKKCISCGNLCADNLNYCPQCETSLSNDIRFTTSLDVNKSVSSSVTCPGCGSNCSSILAYCTECGFKL